MSQLDRSFTCGKCRKKFHIDVRETRKGVREEKAEYDPAAVTLSLDSPTWIDRILSRIPRSALIAGPAAIGLFLLWWFLGAMLLPGEPLPVSAEERAVYVVRALLDRQPRLIQPVCFKANAVDCGEWIKHGRPNWVGLTPEQSYQFQTKTTTYPRSKDPAKSGYTASTSVVVSVHHPGIKHNANVDIMTYWVKPTDDSDWLFDLRRSRAANGK
ncbi:MAG: hypothetical protein JNM18_08890 [Planctomycetaceae bacterium]|nr:hypothetical protein [Planctomycetaceae bacterium]